MSESKKLHRYDSTQIYWACEHGERWAFPDGTDAEFYKADEAQAEIDRLQKEVDDITDNYYRILTAHCDIIEQQPSTLHKRHTKTVSR